MRCMDPDTSKKVKDLLGLMEGISSDIDIKAELDKITSRMEALEEQVTGLLHRIDRMDKIHRERQELLKTLRKELGNLFP